MQEMPCAQQTKNDGRQENNGSGIKKPTCGYILLTTAATSAGRGAASETTFPVFGCLNSRERACRRGLVSPVLCWSLRFQSLLPYTSSPRTGVRRCWDG